MQKMRYVSSFIDNRGTLRFRFRRSGIPTHYFKATFGTPEFAAEYEQCLERRKGVPRKRRTINPERAKARRLAEQHSGATSFIYFIGSKSGPIKIGLSSTPHRRLKDIQSAYPFPLEVLALVPGDAAGESELHERLAHRRLAGEWFKRCPEVLEAIEHANRIETEHG